MNRLLLTAAIVAATLSSCSKNEVHQNQSEGNAVSFSTYTGTAVRGVEMDNTELQKTGFGVLAYDHGVLGSFIDTSVPNFMYNTQVTYSSSWTYSPVKYWSGDEYNYYSFFAYAPYETTGVTVSSSASDTGAPTIAYTVNNATPTNMVDFVAGQELNYLKNDGSTSGTVDLNMKHQLTRVSFSAKANITSTDSSADQTYVNVKSIRLLGTAPVSPIDIYIVDDSSTPTITKIDKGTAYNTTYFGSDALYSSATYTFNSTADTDTDETVHTQDGVWSSVATLSTDLDASSLLNTTAGFANTAAASDKAKAYYTTTGVLVQCAQANAVSLFTSTEYLFLIPPVYTTGTPTYQTGIIADATNGNPNLNNIQVEVIYDIVTLDSQLDNGCVASSTNSIAIVEIPAGSLVQGFAYDFLLTINGTSYTDPTSTTTPETEEAFDAVVLTGNVVNWDTTDVNNYPIDVQ